MKLGHITECRDGLVSKHGFKNIFTCNFWFLDRWSCYVIFLRILFVRKFLSYNFADACWKKAMYGCTLSVRRMIKHRVETVEFPCDLALIFKQKTRRVCQLLWWNVRCLMSSLVTFQARNTGGRGATEQPSNRWCQQPQPGAGVRARPCGLVADSYSYAGEGSSLGRLESRRSTSGLQPRLTVTCSAFAAIVISDIKRIRHSVVGGDGGESGDVRRRDVELYRCAIVARSPSVVCPVLHYRKKGIFLVVRAQTVCERVTWRVTPSATSRRVICSLPACGDVSMAFTSTVFTATGDGDLHVIFPTARNVM